MTERGDHWLDGLARSAAAGSLLTRRTVVRAGAVTALVAGPLRFLVPASAPAAITDVQACIDAANAQALEDLQRCSREPLARLKAAQDAVAAAQKRLEAAKTARDQARQGRAVGRASADADKAAGNANTCSFIFLWQRDHDANDCRSQGLPPAISSPTTPPAKAPTCDPMEEIQCGNICCNAIGHPECCFCTKVGMFQCCANGSNCQCCGPGA